MISLYIPGVPVPQGAVKTFIAGGKARGRHSNAKELQDYRARIAMVASEEMARAGAHAGQLIDAPVEIEVDFYMPRPKSHFGSGKNAQLLKASAPAFPGTRPDLSHLIRAFEDGLSGVVIRDDSLVARVTASKKYAGKPRTEARIKVLPLTVGAAEGGAR
jgi:Holliday junction resolvase RusA-like endonuclease